jgi:phosphoglycerate kinase
VLVGRSPDLRGEDWTPPRIEKGKITMTKKTLKDVNLAGKRIVMRVDFNVPIKEGVITDDTRIKGALPSIKYVLEQGGSLVLMSHLGRPKGNGYEASFSLKPVAECLAKMLDKPVTFAPDCQNADAEVAAMQAGDIVMLENTRFYVEEQGKVKQAKGQSDEDFAAAKAEVKANQRAMAEKLASYGDIYCNDAFGSAHRAHASTAIVDDYMDVCVAGFLLEKEIEYLGNAVENPSRPFVAILGGAKVSDKLAVVNKLLDKVDTLIIGGGMAYTFLKAMGHNVGGSLCELDQLDYATEMIEKAKANGKTLLLPIDNIAADKFDAEANTQEVGNEIPDGWMALDIGPKTTALYSEAVATAKTVLWNGPMGCFEMAKFANGTFGVCQAVADSDSVSIIGGGDSVSAVNKSGLAEKMSHISTGGGASLELLEGKILPGVAALDDK